MVFLLNRKSKSHLKELSEQKYLDKKIEDQVAKEWISQLNDLMSQTQLYKTPNLKLKDIAHKIDISPHQLSQLLNDNLGKSFSSFINEYRIQAACQLITKSHHLSLEGIGKEVGFNSKSTFFSTFKKMKGMTPSQFKSNKSTPSL